MKKDLFLLSAPVIFLAGVGVWFWAFPKKINRDLEGPFRAVLMWQKVSPLTKQEKFERYDTKVKFRFAMRGTPILPRGFAYNPQGSQAAPPTGNQVTYTLAARNYRLVTEKNGLRKAHVQMPLVYCRDFRMEAVNFWTPQFPLKRIVRHATLKTSSFSISSRKVGMWVRHRNRF
jgi:hypothetical protein